MHTSSTTASVMMTDIRSTVITIPAIRPAFGPSLLPFNEGTVTEGDVFSFMGSVCGLSVLGPAGGGTGGSGLVGGTMLGGQLVLPNKAIKKNIFLCLMWIEELTV